MYPFKPLLHPSFSFKLKRCYFYQDQQCLLVRKVSKPNYNPISTPLYIHIVRYAMMVRVHRLNTVHFKGLSIRSVSCYTLLSGFRLPWPPSDCLNVLTPFWSSKPIVVSLIVTLGAFQSTVSAYQKRSTRWLFLQVESDKNSSLCTFVVWESVKGIHPPIRQSFLYYTW